jgi:hypothetical protein
VKPSLHPNLDEAMEWLLSTIAAAGLPARPSPFSLEPAKLAASP